MTGSGPGYGVVVVSRSCPPDVGGYQRQFSLLLPHLSEGLDIYAVAATRIFTRSPTGWPAIRTIVLPAHLLPRRVRGAVDPVLVLTALVVGLSRTLLYRRRYTLLLLSPGLRGSWILVRLWDRLLGPVVVRFPTAGDASRLRPFRHTRRSAGVGPAPSQLGEIEKVGLAARHVPNAVVEEALLPEGRVIAVVGRLIARKRVDLVLAAWAAIADSHPGWRLAVVGSGQGERDDVEGLLRRQVVKKGIPRVRFHGEADGPWATVGTAGVFVIASEREGSPNAVLEALQRGVPVIAPSVPMEQWFSPAPPFEPFVDDEGLTKVLDMLLSDPERRSALRDAGTKFVRTNHSLNGAARRWAEILTPDSEVSLKAGWARVPIAVLPHDLVLDVGSGRFPNRRADVLCERFVRRGNRWAVVDRPFVVADAGALPFRDHAFAVAMASHLVEHVDDPRAVVMELARVGREGYVETPHRRFERIVPEANHRWAIRAKQGVLICEPNRWAPRASSGFRRLITWLYYAGEAKEYPTIRLPGCAGQLLRLAARCARASLNRTGVVTARYRFNESRPPSVEILGEAHTAHDPSVGENHDRSASAAISCVPATAL